MERLSKAGVFCLLSFSCLGATWIISPGKGSHESVAASVDNTFDFIQTWTNATDPAATTLTVSVSGITAGNLLVCYVKNLGATTVSSVSGNASGAWTASPANVQHANGDMSARFFYLLNANASDTTITITFSASTGGKSAIISEWHPNTPALFDTSAGSSGTGTSVSSGNVTTAGAGLVLGGYANYDFGAHSALMAIGGVGGVNCPAVEPGFTNRTWGVQTSGTITGAATTTLSFSTAWIGNAIAFKGTGARSATGTNYAQLYIDGAGQTNGTTLTPTIMTNSSHGTVPSWTLSPSTPTGFTIAASTFTKTFPLSVNGTSYATGSASKCFALLHNVSNTYAQMVVDRNSRLTVSGFVYFGPLNSGTGLFDYVVIGTLGGRYAALQLNKQTYNVNVETNPSGVTTHSTGFTATPSTGYKFCLFTDFKNDLCSFRMWNLAGTQVVNETPDIDSTPDDISQIRFGNNETGTSTTETSKLEHLLINYMGTFPIEP
jgi:hypothetical protein